MPGDSYVLYYVCRGLWQVKTTPPTHDYLTDNPMEKIKISSEEELIKLFSEKGFRQTVEAFAILEVPKALIQDALTTLSIKDNLVVIKLKGYTIKFDSALLAKVNTASVVDLSLFEATIDNKPIKWARITAAS